MSEHWNTYFTMIGDKPASFLLDLEPWQNGENETFVHLYQLRVLLNEPDPNGFTGNQEASVLYAIEDAIQDSLGNQYMFVGRVTTDGRRDFYYYTNSADGTRLKEVAEENLGNYKYSVGLIEEKEPGAFYREYLYPDKFDWHRMMNRQLVDKLTDLGDHLEQPRTVQHWIYFSSEESRESFKESVRKDGFLIEDQGMQESAYSLRISRNDVVELHSISQVTDYLVSAAQQFEGEYDGWETMVIKEKEGFLGGLKKLF